MIGQNLNEINVAVSKSSARDGYVLNGSENNRKRGEDRRWIPHEASPEMSVKP